MKNHQIFPHHSFKITFHQYFPCPIIVLYGMFRYYVYVTVLAIEYSTQIYQCLELVVITALLCSNNNSLQLCYVFEAWRSAGISVDSYSKLEMSTLLLCSVKIVILSTVIYFLLCCLFI